MDLLELEVLRPQIIRFLFSRCGDEAEDVVAEVFGSISLLLVRGLQVTPSYVWQACRWEAINHFRRRAQRHENPNAMLPDVAVLPEEYDDPNSDGRVALAKLSPYRQKIVLLRVEGYSYGEISEMLAVSYAAAKQAGRVRETHPRMPISKTPNGILTPRCREVLTGLADGLSYREIGTLLMISPNTVKNLLTTAYVALGAKSGPQAVAIALRTGSIS